LFRESFGSERSFSIKNEDGQVFPSAVLLLGSRHPLGGTIPVLTFYIL
jgi:hypothetical protein